MLTSGTRGASIFRNGADQAVRLPQELRFPEDLKVARTRNQGDRLRISPVRPDWDCFLARSVEAPDDFRAAERCSTSGARATVTLRMLDDSGTAYYAGPAAQFARADTAVIDSGRIYEAHHNPFHYYPGWYDYVKQGHIRDAHDGPPSRPTSPRTRRRYGILTVAYCLGGVHSITVAGLQDIPERGTFTVFT